MTSYSHTIIFDDSAILTLQEALKCLINECDAHLKDGPKAPYWAHKQSAEEILRRLHENLGKVSTFFARE